MRVSRRDFVRIAGKGLGGVALLASLPAACSSRAGRPRSEAEAKSAVARAIYGRELAHQGERLMERARLGAPHRQELTALMKLARSGATLDRGVMRDHADLVKRLLRELWGDDELLWHAVGYPNGPGVCTVFDLYTRPPVEAHLEKRRGRKGHGRG